MHKPTTSPHGTRARYRRTEFPKENFLGAELETRARLSPKRDGIANNHREGRSFRNERSDACGSCWRERGGFKGSAYRRDQQVNDSFFISVIVLVVIVDVVAATFCTVCSQGRISRCHVAVAAPSFAKEDFILSSKYLHLCCKAASGKQENSRVCLHFRVLHSIQRRDGRQSDWRIKFRVAMESPRITHLVELTPIFFPLLRQ